MSQLNIHVTADPEILEAIRGLTQALKRLPLAQASAPAPAVATPPLPSTPPTPAPEVKPTPALVAPAPTPAAAVAALTAPEDVQPQAPDAPTPVAALRALIAAKGREVGVKLLQEFGSASLTGLKQEHHAVFVARCQELLAA
jgi:hypothetical protein